MSFAAQAQTPVLGPCGNVASTGSVYTDFSATAPYASAPWPLGTGTPPHEALTYDANGKFLGAVAWWYYPLPGGSWGLSWAVVSADVWGIAYRQLLTANLSFASSASDPLKAFNDIAKSRIVLPLSAPALAAVWCPQWAAMAAGIPPRAASADGTMVPPAVNLIDSRGVSWSIGATALVLRDSVPTNGHGLQILLKGGSIYVQSPNGLIWWKWTGSNTWLRLTTTSP